MTAHQKIRSATGISFTRDWALFLDVDGTLLDLTEHPARVTVSPEVLELIEHLRARLNGAIALISGRELRNLDELFGMKELPAAGLHGIELRPGNGSLDTRVQTVDKAALDLFRDRLQRLADTHDGLWLEDKGLGIAVHYRQAPELQEQVENVLTEVLAERSHEFQLQRGKMLAEIKSRRFDKGFAIREFMDSSPFSGRTPVFIGDDVTDEDGFAVVNEMQGISIKVGDGNSLARYHLPAPRDVINWLREYAHFLESD